MNSLLSKKLAVNGGTPVRKKPWSAGPFHFKEESAALQKLLAGPALPLARGANIMAYRELLKKMYRVDHVIPTSSGTTAIHVALAAAGVGPGDEVIVSVMTDYGSVSGILQLNAIPVFCDVDRGSLLMDHKKVPALITRRTKAIMPVHNGGYGVDMRAILRIARRRGLKVIEDCAQAHWVRWGKTFLGCFGDFGCFSTNESKHMKTGEGGFVICRSRPEALYAELFADKCYPRFPEAPRTPAFPALNVRMSELNAVVGIEQARKLPGWIRARHQMGKRLEALIRQFPLRPHGYPDGMKCSYWWFSCYLDKRRTDIPVQDFIEALRAEGIWCGNKIQPIVPGWEIFRKLNRNPNCFRTYRPLNLRKGMYGLDKWPEAAWAFENIIRIPMNQHTGESELRDLKRALEKIFA